MQEDITADEHINLMTDMRGAKEKLQHLTLKIRHKESLLDVNEHAQLERLVKNPYITSKVNALAVKQRLRDRLRSRKFELEQVERSFRKQVNDEKINEHTAASVKRRDPSISKLASAFNVLQRKLVEMINAGRAPPGAAAPSKIETKGLFALDVDDAIWQDVGLSDDVNEDGIGLPPWLADDKVREGIRAVLEGDRCHEEDARLIHECSSICLWFKEEWDIVNFAIEQADTDGLRYFLNLHRNKLLRYCAKWQESLDPLYPQFSESFPEWGPSEQQVHEIRLSLRTEAVGSIENDDGNDSGEEFDEDNMELFDTLETLDLADAFRANLDEEYLD
ncbi:hypothetical protein H0H92_011665 [Tricholoma furcatifolium]|nr:hypothetical protein H0H92_011665 [Tricholoma furcatifolium]